jgi:hypothetical protein
MKRHRVWIEILILATVIACAMALLIASLGAAAGAAVDMAEPSQTTNAGTGKAYEGMVTCSRCGARHSPALARTAEVCVRVCVHGGASFALVDSDSTYLLDGDTNALKRVAGQRVRIRGNLSGQTIKVASVVAES